MAGEIPLPTSVTRRSTARHDQTLRARVPIVEPKQGQGDPFYARRQARRRTLILVSFAHARAKTQLRADQQGGRYEG